MNIFCCEVFFIHSQTIIWPLNFSGLFFFVIHCCNIFSCKHIIHIDHRQLLASHLSRKLDGRMAVMCNNHNRLCRVFLLKKNSVFAQHQNHLYQQKSETGAGRDSSIGITVYFIFVGGSNVDCCTIVGLNDDNIEMKKNRIKQKKTNKEPIKIATRQRKHVFNFFFFFLRLYLRCFAVNQSL